MTERPNVLFIFCDQLRASALPVFGEVQIETPNIDRLAAEGLVLGNSISTCPVCTPARAMLLTGRHPQTTGHIMNSIRTRHSEISIGDAFGNAGYRTGWIGKWHLHTGTWPATNRMPMHPDWVPKGRDRLGFEHWRAYNQHMVYFNGFVQRGDWEYEQWDGYETDALGRFAVDFIRETKDVPFCLFLSPHQPHWTPQQFAPEKYYERLPQDIKLPDNVPDELLPVSTEMYRHYLAMILAVDEMVGTLLKALEENGILDNTIVVFTADHGTQGGSQGLAPWRKQAPYEGSIRIPAIVRYGRKLPAGERCDALMSLPDMFPTLCDLADVDIPRSVEGKSMLSAWRDEPHAYRHESLFIMNFSAGYDWLESGQEWRGVRTPSATYVRYLSGREELYDLSLDPLQKNNLVGQAPQLQERLSAKLDCFLRLHNDALVPVTDLANWFDNQRRVVRNAYGELPHPEQPPDWSLLRNPKARLCISSN